MLPSLPHGHVTPTQHGRRSDNHLAAVGPARVPQHQAVHDAGPVAHHVLHSVVSGPHLGSKVPHKDK